MSKVIAVIGATGAQGHPVVRHLLAPSEDGSPSPWKVRALTRDTNHPRAKELQALGAELVQGSFLNSSALHELFTGAYGAFVNTDGFTVGAAAEMNAAFNIWEIARLRKVRHFVWSNLDYALRLGNYNPVYSCDHTNAKGRFGEFLASYPNDVNDANGTLWTLFTTGPYMDMLGKMFAPFKIRDDGTRVFSSPIGEHGTIPLVALDDLGWWARYIFDNAPSTTGKNIKIASHPATFPDIVETFKNVTGLPAEYKPLSMDDYFKLWNGDQVPVASDVGIKSGKTWEDNFRAWWAMWRDNIVERDMEWVKGVHMPTTLEKWMRDNAYTGMPRPDPLLKNEADGRSKIQRLNSFQAKL